ncbi:MAG: heme exporter protein CcmD [Dokdonella sp.]|nr:heme exporter protein CcmD [Dokdonella sp.]
MRDFLEMGGYGSYVWASLAVFLVVMAVELWSARAQQRRQLAQVRDRLRRSAARNRNTP